MTDVPYTYCTCTTHTVHYRLIAITTPILHAYYTLTTPGTLNTFTCTLTTYLLTTHLLIAHLLLSYYYILTTHTIHILLTLSEHTTLTAHLLHTAITTHLLHDYYIY